MKQAMKTVWECVRTVSGCIRTTDPVAVAPYTTELLQAISRRGASTSSAGSSSNQRGGNPQGRRPHSARGCCSAGVCSASEFSVPSCRSCWEIRCRRTTGMGTQRGRRAGQIFGTGDEIWNFRAVF